mmetsp:Transcript_56989/g.125170  ORF Transcript_56989/g.125170 Transcript_56989/m.125170 type:complete len:373 (+) Transcript_56989:2-1120(+)
MAEGGRNTAARHEGLLQLVASRHETVEAHRHRGGETCEGSQEVSVTLGSATKLLSPRRSLPSGGHSAHPCEEVNSEYRGVIWLLCSNGALESSVSHCLSASTATPENCTAQKQTLEVTYLRAYVELTRLVQEYEVLVNSTACEALVNETHMHREKLSQERTDGLITRLTLLTGELQQLRQRIEGMRGTEAKLRAQITRLAEKCKAMDETISSLDKVRDAIQVMDLCPGLSRAEFHIPVWIGHWVEKHFDVNNRTDAEVDADMNELCNATSFGEGRGPARAAESSEIEQGTVEGAPIRNTAPVPIMGACPNCEGVKDSTDSTVVHASGHARICWDPEAALSSVGRRLDCSSGKKAVLCVVDRGNMRLLPKTAT